MKEGLTPAERQAVVEESIRLIKRPDTFVQGEWKCPLYEKPKTHELVPVTDYDLRVGRVHETGESLEKLVPAKDTSGRPLFAYCVEGAVNQAGINVLGVDRAITYGAASGEEKYGEADVQRDSKFIEYLSVNEVARVMFADIFREYGDMEDPMFSESPAQLINDGEKGDLYGSGDRTVAHGRVMQMLRRRLTQLRKGK